MFAGSFVTTWLFFSIVWYLIALTHGDLDEEHLPDSESQANGTWTPCVWNIHGYASCFLFSVETQHTIG